MRTILLASILVSSVASAGVNETQNGQTKAVTVATMGSKPVASFTKNGQDVLVWNTSESETCFFFFEDGVSVRMECKDTKEARAAEAAKQAEVAAAPEEDDFDYEYAEKLRARREQNDSRTRASLRNVYASRPQRQQVNCSHRRVGTQTVSDCTAKSVGLDTSIYDRFNQ